MPSLQLIEGGCCQLVSKKKGSKKATPEDAFRLDIDPYAEVCKLVPQSEQTPIKLHQNDEWKAVMIGKSRFEAMQNAGRSLQEAVVVTQQQKASHRFDVVLDVYS